MTGAPGSIEHMALLAEVSDFLYREADLLDERRYEEWLDMLADDYHYSVPLRVNVEYSENDLRNSTRPGRDICWFDEPKSTVELRVQQLLTGVHWAEEPVSRVSHVITNIRIVEERLPEVSLSSRFIVYRNRVSDETDFFVGQRKDTLRKEGGDWKVTKRTLLLDQTVLLAKNLSIFL